MKFFQRLLFIIPLFAVLGAIAAPVDNRCVVPPPDVADDADIGMANVYESILLVYSPREPRYSLPSSLIPLQ